MVTGLHITIAGESVVSALQEATSLDRQTGSHFARTSSFRSERRCWLSRQVQNGGFETGDFTGWTLTGDTHLPGCATYQLVPAVLLLTRGTFAAYFGPVGDTATISQMIATTPGSQYTLTFSWPIRSAAHRIISQVQFGNGASFSSRNFGAAFGWQEFQLDWDRTGQNELSFTFRNDPAYWFLDNVTVTSGGQGGTTPEPGTLGSVRQRTGGSRRYGSSQVFGW